jgi:hypothetical protein
VATFDQGVWTSSDPDFQRLLTATLPAYSPAYGRPDLFVARDAIQRFGGEIVAVSDESMPPDTIF